MISANSAPLLIAAAPNGAHKTRRDHPQLPVTAAQLADTVAQVHKLGARMFHLHVRDAHEKHTLDADMYRAAISAIRERVGGDIFIQATSEAAGIYTAAEQRDALFALFDVSGVDGVSIAPRELLREPSDAEPSTKLFHGLRAREIAIQYILYSVDDVAQYKNLRAEKIIPPDLHSVLLVAGRHDERSPLPDLQKMLTALQSAPPVTTSWMVCAFGANEFDCLREAAKRGGHIRAGFENTLALKSGNRAADNGELIAQFLQHGNPHNRPLATTAQARQILGARAE